MAISLAPRCRKTALEKIVKTLQILQPPVLPGPRLTEIPPELHKAGVTLISASRARASSFGPPVLSGVAVTQGSGSIHDQDLLYALARGTGGHAFFDSNDLDRAFREVEADTREYYLLSYHSSDLRRDGRFRRVTVRVHRSGLELKYSAGYYAPRQTKPVSEREAKRLLAEELSSDLPNTTVPAFVFVNYLRLDKNSYFLPITVLMPVEALLNDGSASQVVVGLDLTDARGRIARKLRDTIPASAGSQHPTGIVQYQTATKVSSGEYTLRLAVVQTATGQVGFSSTQVRLAPADKTSLRVSPLLSGTLRTVTSNESESPLVLNGSELIVNPLSEYGPKRQFTLQYQVECGGPSHGDCDPRETRSSLQCFSSDQPVFTAVPSPSTIRGGATVFRVEVPARTLALGSYMCRVTAINSRAKAFAFGSTRLKIVDGSDLQPEAETAPSAR